MTRNFAGRSQQIPNLYWQQGQPVGAPVRLFYQTKYLLLPNAVTDRYQAHSGTKLDCSKIRYKQIIDYGRAAKVWITLLVEYESVVNYISNKVPFEKYLSATPTCILRRDGTVSVFANP